MSNKFSNYIKSHKSTLLDIPIDATTIAKQSNSTYNNRYVVTSKFLIV